MNAYITIQSGVIVLTLTNYPHWSIGITGSTYIVYEFANMGEMKHVVGEFDTLADAIECVIREDKIAS